MASKQEMMQYIMDHSDLDAGTIWQLGDSGITSRYNELHAKFGDPSSGSATSTNTNTSSSSNTTTPSSGGSTKLSLGGSNVMDMSYRQYLLNNGWTADELSIYTQNEINNLAQLVLGGASKSSVMEIDSAYFADAVDYMQQGNSATTALNMAMNPYPTGGEEGQYSWINGQWEYNPNYTGDDTSAITWGSIQYDDKGNAYQVDSSGNYKYLDLGDTSEPDPTRGPIQSDGNGYLYQVDSDGNYIPVGPDPNFDPGLTDWQRAQLDADEADRKRQAEQDAANLAQRRAELAETRRQWDTLSAYQKGQLEADEARLAEDTRQFNLSYGLSLDEFEWQKQQDLWSQQFQEDTRQWNQNWELSQNPSAPQPTGFAGWNQQYDWSPTMAMQQYQSGVEDPNAWIASQMSYEMMNDPSVYGSGAWAEQAANWWDASRINRTLEEQGRAGEMAYTQMAPSVVAKYFQGIDPWTSARNINYEQQGGNPYEMASMPSLGSLSKLTSDQLAQLESGYENLHTPYYAQKWEDVLRNAYRTAPPEERQNTLLY